MILYRIQLTTSRASHFLASRPLDREVKTLLFDGHENLGDAPWSVQTRELDIVVGKCGGDRNVCGSILLNRAYQMVRN
jgi:hypothetical protein